jgi:hypothetical protein
MGPEEELDEIRRHLEEGEERARKMSEEGQAREQAAQDAASPVPSLNPPHHIVDDESDQP